MRELHWCVTIQFEGGNATFPAKGLTKEIAIARATIRLTKHVPNVKIIDVLASKENKTQVIEVKKL